SGATQTVQVSGNGTYTTPTGNLPTSAGAYQWAVSYSGDRDNQGAGPVNAGTPEVAVGPGVAIVGSALYLVGATSMIMSTSRPAAPARRGAGRCAGLLGELPAVERQKIEWHAWGRHDVRTLLK